MTEKIGLYLNKFEFKDNIYLLLLINNKNTKEYVTETVNKYLQKTFVYT